MIINDQIRDEKLQYDIDREAAKTSVLSSAKIDKYENLNGEGILPSNQQQITEQAKFTYSPLGKAFEKQIKTIEDQGQKQVENLKPKEQTKAIEDKSNNQSKAAIIFNDLISKKKIILMNELCESFDKDKSKFEYVGSTKDKRFYEYMDSKELFNKKNNQFKFDDALKKQEELLNKTNKVKIGRKKHEQEEVIADHDKTLPLQRRSF